MNRLLLPLLLLAGTHAAHANPDRLRHEKLTPVTDLGAGQDVRLNGTTDGHPFVAHIVLDKQGNLASISLVENDMPVRMPTSCCEGLAGANHAWVEERGALTTIVVEGAIDGKTWRLALESHEEQLWLKRLSRQGERRDSFTYFDRKDFEPSKVRLRHAPLDGL